jgi:hypothetical protein
MSDTKRGNDARDVIDEVRRIANNAIYFNDGSDYEGRLLDICRKCGMTEESIGESYMEENVKIIPTCTEPFSRCLDCDDRGGCERYREHRGNARLDRPEGAKETP